MGQEAILESPLVEAGSPAKCMKFAYHMHDGKYPGVSPSEMGELRLYTVSVDGTRNQLFYNSAPENAWKEFAVSLPSENFDYRVIFCMIRYLNFVKKTCSKLMVNYLTYFHLKIRIHL